MVNSTILLKRNTKRIWLSIKGNPPSDQVEAFFFEVLIFLLMILMYVLKYFSIYFLKIATDLKALS